VLRIDIIRRAYRIVIMMKTPRVILGTMTFGGVTTQDVARTMILDFCDAKWNDLVKDDPMLDSAIMYQNGKTEVVLGDILTQGDTEHFPSSLSLASKANPFTKDTNLSPSGVRKQLESSLTSLQRDHLDIFYLHAPDVNHDIEQTLEEVQKLYKEKKFAVFGLSNFSAWETAYIYGFMTSRNYIAPTVYQGMYNLLSRQVEIELFPCLRKMGMSFYAYNPLAGGMLAHKYQPFDNDDEAAKRNTEIGDRFAGNGVWAKRYRERFQQKEQFDALEIVRENLKDGLTMAEASLRWLRYHSELKEQDGIIIGASKLLHYESNMQSLSKGPLPNDLVESFNKASNLCQGVCPDYSRGFSGSSVVR